MCVRVVALSALSIPFETTVGESGSDTAVIAGSTVGVLVVVLILIGVISAVLYKR